MMVREAQITPWYFHWIKIEDIINRGGGNLVIRLANATPDWQLDHTPVKVQVDGITHRLESQEKLILKPGESVSLPSYLYHAFYGQPEKGPVLVGEVSSVNDDTKDNRFLENIGRFTEVEEDEPPLYPLCNEY